MSANPAPKMVMKSDKYFTLNELNLGPQQIQRLAKEKFDQKMQNREHYHAYK